MNWVKEYFEELLNLTNEMAPYLLLGFLVAGILHVYIHKETISKYLGKNNFKSVLYASLLGIPLPLCSCGVIPTGIAFNKEGASKGATVSFLISTPQTGVDSILITYSMLGLPFAIIRPVVALISGLMGGLFTNWLDKETASVQPVFSIQPQQATQQQSFAPVGLNIETKKTETVDCGCDGECHTPNKNRSKIAEVFVYGFIDFMEDIAKWLIIGLFLAAFISILIPDDFFSSYITNPVLGIFIILIASIPLYICATGSVPLAAVLLMKGISPGAALVFLMAGPATNIATITVLSKSLGKRSASLYIASIVISSVIFGLLIDYTLPSDWFSITSEHAHNHSAMLPNWFELTATIILGGLLINAILKKNELMWFKKKSIETNLSLQVNGMTCNHCKANVEKGVAKIRGVEQVVVSLSEKRVDITGTNIKKDDVTKVIKDLGYTVE